MQVGLLSLKIVEQGRRDHKMPKIKIGGKTKHFSYTKKGIAAYKKAKKKKVGGKHG